MTSSRCDVVAVRAAGDTADIAVVRDQRFSCDPCIGFPDLDHLIFTSGDHAGTVGREHGIEGCRRVALQHDCLFASRDFPQPYGAVFAGSHELLSVRAKRDRVNPVAVTDKSHDGPAAGDVVEASRPVPATGRDGLPVRTEAQAVDAVGADLTYQITRGCIPDSDRFVPGTSCNQRAIRTEGDAINSVFVSLQRKDLDPFFTVPDFGGLVLRSRHDALAVGTESDGRDRGGVSLHLVQQRSPVSRPQADELVVSRSGQPLSVRAERGTDDAMFVVAQRNQDRTCEVMPDSASTADCEHYEADNHQKCPNVEVRSAR